MVTHYCLGFMFDADRARVVLIRKKRPSWQSGKLNGVGGHLLEDERADVGMAREFQEEADCYIPPENWIEVASIHGGPIGNKFYIYVFATFGDIERAATATDEPICVCSCDCLPDDVVGNLRWIIPLCLDATTRKPVVIQQVGDST